MVEHSKMTVETLREQYPAIYREILEAGKTEMYQTVHAHFADLSEVCGDDAELLVESFKAGRTVHQTQQTRIEKLHKLSAQQAAKLQAMESPNSPITIEPTSNPSERSDHELD